MTTDLITPVVGITMDSEPGSAERGSYSKFPWYALRQNYAASVKRAGGLPFPLAHEPELVEMYLDDIDALIVTGGAFDVNPELYGADTRHEAVTTKDTRTLFELALLQGAMAKDMPILGICGGQQLLHVALGGSLIQHLPDEVPGALAHEQPNPRDQTSHGVEIVPGTLLADIVGAGEIQVNSAHHQAARDEVPALHISARAPDGVIEGIEARDLTFCIGVQWHPEFEITDADVRLFAAFIDAAREYANLRIFADFQS